MTQDWSSWLDRLEAGVTAARTALAQVQHDSGAFELPTAELPPPDLGPLPPALEQRARGLLRDNDALTAELAAACTAAGRQLRLVSALQHRTAGASFLDARG